MKKMKKIIKNIICEIYNKMNIYVLSFDLLNTNVLHKENAALSCTGNVAIIMLVSAQ